MIDMNTNEHTPSKGKSASMAGLLVLTALTGVAIATALAAPVTAHDCSGLIMYVDCGTCTSGTHHHSTTVGWCDSSCPNPSSCPPGSQTQLASKIRKNFSVNLSRDFASPCGGQAAYDGIDGQWFEVFAQDFRSYSSTSTPGLASSTTFYSASCSPLPVVMVDRVPPGTRYVHLNADAGEGTATFISRP